MYTYTIFLLVIFSIYLIFFCLMLELMVHWRLRNITKVVESPRWLCGN
jgi:hypothetical protein